MILQSINPYNSQLLAEFEELNSHKIEKTLIIAENSFSRWKKTTFRQRKEILLKCAQTLRGKRDFYARLITSEMGKVIKESLAEVEKSAWVCEYYAKQGEEFLKDTPLSVEAAKSFITYDPLGTILAIMPWNFPFYQVFRCAPPILFAGNTIILKHASNVPQCALEIEKIWLESGLPEGTFQTLLVSSSKVNTLIDDPRIHAVNITGSVEAGSKVAERAGKNIKKTVLELGGSDPFIITSEADVTEAAKIAAKARMINCGQSCIASKRFIAHQKIADKFLGLFRQYLEELHFGNPLDTKSDYASMASEHLRIELEKQVDESISSGTEIYWQDKKSDQKQAFFNPLILLDPSKDSPAYNEELFGPVATVFIAKDDEDAVNIANDSVFGLGASIWSKNTVYAQKLARKIDSGLIYINSMVASRPEIPFGGVKKSGYGRELFYLGIREFTNQKTIFRYL
ncbi:MAG: NAD-dependent succinate-semialdehyde dehydrogenase [Bacteroidales bacterium]|nr:NAD-dependent succinate-semialdehyde dehydrogenase [Bacteroidales bacterium]